MRRGLRQLVRRRGFAVVTVAFIVAIFAVIGMAAVTMLGGSAQMAMDEYASQQAFDVAEAGIGFAMQGLVNDEDWSDNAGYARAFGPCSFTISFSAQAEDSATIRSDGTVGGVTRSMTQAVSRGSGGAFAFSQAVYTEQNINMSGQAHTNINGDVVAGNRVSGSGQARLDIAGDLDTNLGVSTSGQSHVGVSGETSTGYDTADVPQPDWNYWMGRADHVVTGNLTLGSGQGTFTYSGVYYVTGSVTISGQADVIVNGTIVTRGGFSLSGQSRLTVHPLPGFPAVVSEGNINLSGQTSGTFDIDGWLISSSQINLSGQSDLDITGGLLAAGNISLSGQATFDITFDEGPEGGFIGGEPGEGESVIRGLWQEVC